MKAIFHKDFNYSSRVRNAGWSIKAKPEPQSWPREVVEAAVKAGCAEIVPPRRAKAAAGPGKSGD